MQTNDIKTIDDNLICVDCMGTILKSVKGAVLPVIRLKYRQHYAVFWDKIDFSTLTDRFWQFEYVFLPPETEKNSIMDINNYIDICQQDNSLRNYQQSAKYEIFQTWDKVDSVMFQMPTGTGKTRLFTSIVKDINQYSIRHYCPLKNGRLKI